MNEPTKQACSIENIRKAPTNNEILYIMEKWLTLYNEVASRSINHYCLIHSSLPKDISNLYFSTTRTYSIIITQLKLNHEGLPYYLKKWIFREYLRQFKYCRF